MKRCLLKNLKCPREFKSYRDFWFVYCRILFYNTGLIYNKKIMDKKYSYIYIIRLCKMLINESE
jgi:ABC-type polysaccharide/polyol phosphate export permease